jgi:DNA polymerase-1
MLYLVDQKQPDCLNCAFDPPGPTFRHEMYEPYKADRGEMPDELVPQIPKIQYVLEALGIPVVSLPGYEADDVLATIARQCDENGIQCFLVSGDKDCRQLITDNVVVYNIRKDEVFHAERLRQEWGIRPNQVVDFQSLVGDNVDNVPGVPSIGPKTAQALLQQYETLEGLFAHLSEVKGAKQQKLIEGREQAFLSRELVRLNDHLPLAINWAASRVGPFDNARLAELFRELGFRSLRERFASQVAVLPAEPVEVSYTLVNTPDRLHELVAQLSRQDRISLDTETTHLMPRWAEIVGYSFAWKPGQAYYVPVRGPADAQVIDPQAALDALRPVLENPNIRKVGQNLKYDMIVLRAAGVQLAGVGFDTIIASYLLEAGDRTHNLDEIAKRYLGHETIKIGELIGRGKDQLRMDQVPLALITDYAAEDADIPLRLEPIFAKRLAEAELSVLNETLEVPLIEVLAELEYNGVRVDLDRLAELSARYGQRMVELEKEIEELAGHPLNIASPKQLAQVLFQELKLPVVKKAKTGPSTDAKVLEELAVHHPLPRKIVDYRQFAKLKNTYVDALPALVHPQTGRVHCSFNQVVAATGRLSSSDPNLQNIPVRTQEGREIRSAFLPGEMGWKLLAADYSQIELRVLAHFTNDAALCEAFAGDEDIHVRVASEVYDVPPGFVTPEMRRSAKAVNFGVIYGQSAFGLGKALGIPKQEAAQFIDNYFARYRGVEDFVFRTLYDCRADGYVKTILGRRRAIEGIRYVDLSAGDEARRRRRQLTLPERTAVNTVIQGSAADLIKLAMVAIHGRLARDDLHARMLLQIHDELVFEAPADEVGALAELVREEMTGVLRLHVPLKVDVAWGDNWAQT